MAKVSVEVAAPLEQLPSDCDAEGSMYRQFTVELATSVPEPENVLLVVEVK